MELGRVGFKERDVDDLLTLYGLDDGEERDRLLDLAREANNPGWWHRYGDVMPNWFHSYLGLEMAADADPDVRGPVRPRPAADPGLRAGRRPARPAGPAACRGRAPGRAADDPAADADPAERRPALWAVVDEAVLRRPIGGEDVLRAQLEHLIEACRAAERHAAGHAVRTPAGTPRPAARSPSCGSPSSDLPDIVYIEQLTSALYLDKREDVDEYVATMEALLDRGRTRLGDRGPAQRGPGADGLITRPRGRP